MSAVRISRAAFALTRLASRRFHVLAPSVNSRRSGWDSGAMYSGAGVAAALLAIGSSTVQCERKQVGGRKPTEILKDKIAAMIDVDGDGNLTAEEIGAFFKKIDMGVNGTVTCDALCRFLSKKGLPTNQRLAVSELFAQLDADGSGDISKEELIGMFGNRKRRPADILKHKITAVIDANGDGSLSAEELSAAFNKMDLSGDGSITYSEMYNWLVKANVISRGDSAAAKELFKEIDVDGSGEIEKGEFCNMFLDLVLKPTEVLKGAIVRLIDTDGDGDLSDEELKAFFAKVDVNKDGSISVGELQTYIRTHGVKSEQRVVKDLFDEIDKDGSGDISPEEFCLLFKREVRSQSAVLKEKIARIIDADGDGDLTRDELYDFFDKVDVNGDGSVTFEELRNYLMKHGLTAKESLALKQVYSEIDADGSGELSKSELVQFFNVLLL